MSNVPQNIKELGLTTYDSFLEYSDVRSLLLKKLQSLPNWVEIEKTFSGAGTLELILHLISVSHEISSFMNLRGVQESFLEFAQLDASIYSKARELGYRINRHTAPEMLVEYLAVPTIRISCGDIVGTYLDYDLVYFGDSKLIEQGDLIHVKVGKFLESSHIFDTSSIEGITNIVSPAQLLSVDNTSVRVLHLGVLQEKTLFPEDYIVFERYADFSESTTEAKLFIADFKLVHGLAKTLSSNVNNNYTVQYIETDGKLNSIEIQKISTTNNYRFVDITSYGYKSDSSSDIVKNAPLLYSLLRRAITELDYVFLLSSLPQLRSASVNQYGGVPGVYDIRATASGINYSVSINSYTYSYQNTNNLPVDSVLTILYKQLRRDSNISPELLTTFTGKVIRVYSQSSRLPLNIITSSNLSITTITPQVLVKNGILHIRYVSSNTIDEPVPLSSSEYSSIEKVIEYYKAAGLTLYYEHALKETVSLVYVLSLSSSTDKDLVTTLVNEVVSSYEYSIDKIIDSSDILTAIKSYINSRFNTDVIQYSIDSVPVIKYIDKNHYSKINLSLTFV